METFKYELQPTTRRVKNILDKGYYGRSPQNELFFGGDAADAFFLMGDSSYNQPKNRTFSALPQTDAEKQAIINQSWIRNKLPVPGSAIAPSNQQMMEMANVRGQAGQKRTGAGDTPPNWRDNLLNYIVSPKGRGMAQGLLEASGYSEVPVTFGQALAMGMNRGTEAETAAYASSAAKKAAQFEQDKFAYKKEQDILNRALQYAQIKPASIPGLQQNIRAMLEGQGLKPGTPEYDIAFANAIKDYLAKSSGTTVDIAMKSEGKGNEQMFINAANQYNATGTKILETADLAKTQNISLDTMMRLMQTMDEKDFGTLAITKLKLSQLAKQLGVNPDDLSNVEVFHSLAGDFVMGQISKTKGAISNKEMAYFEQISPGLSRSKQGNLLQLQMAKLVNQFHIDMTEKRADFDIDAAEKGWDSRKTNAEWIKKSRELYKDNKVLGNLEKKMENNIINQALDKHEDNLMFNARSEEDNKQIRSQIDTWYEDQGAEVVDIKLVGYTDEGYPEYLVDLGNDRYEKRTITRDMRKQ